MAFVVLAGVLLTVAPALADENFVFYYVFGPSCG
jgi:hypothetical protein